MQGRSGNGGSRARRWAIGSSLAVACATVAAGAASSTAEPGGGPAKGHAPTVTITKGPPSKTSSNKAKFKFKSNKGGTKFKCKLDGGSYQKCSSPRTVSVGTGKHKFSVYGVNLGVPGPPDTRKWKVTGKAGGRHHLAQNFVFDGGPGSPLNGIVVSADGPAGCAQQYCLVKEPTLGADAAVIGGGPYADCPHEFHYHGFLFGKPDQPSGCGWGPVTELSIVAPGIVVQNTSVAITLEEAALLARKPKDARAQLSVASERLAAALQNPSIDPASEQALRQAADLDSEADAAFQKAAAADGKRRKKKMNKADKLISQALALKRGVWDRLVYGV